MRCHVDKGKSGADGQKYQSINQLIKDAYGLSAKQIRKQMEWAELKAQSETFLDEASIPESPEGEFSVILAKLAARGITPRRLADFDQESRKAMGKEDYLDREGLPHQMDLEEEGCKGLGLGMKKLIGSAGKLLERPLRIAAVAAACLTVGVVIFLAPRIDAIAKKRYQYEARVESGERGRIVWNNQDDYTLELSNLEEAYAQIKEKLGIAILKLNYIPEGMALSKLLIRDTYARMSFVYAGNRIYMLEILYPMDNSDSYSSDRNIYKSVFNEWIGQEISIERNRNSEGYYEYNAYFEVDDAHYIIEGIMEEKEFVNIIRDLLIEK